MDTSGLDLESLCLSLHPIPLNWRHIHEKAQEIVLGWVNSVVLLLYGCLKEAQADEQVTELMYHVAHCHNASAWGLEWMEYTFRKEIRSERYKAWQAYCRHEWEFVE